MDRTVSRNTNGENRKSEGKSYETFLWSDDADVLGRNRAGRKRCALPQRKVAAFVVEKFRRHHALTGKRAKTFALRLRSRQVDEGSIGRGGAGGTQVSIRILEQEASGIYVAPAIQGRIEAMGTSNECCC
jgi:hypothetical protein